MVLLRCYHHRQSQNDSFESDTKDKRRCEARLSSPSAIAEDDKVRDMVELHVSNKSSVTVHRRRPCRPPHYSLLVLSILVLACCSSLLSSTTTDSTIIGGVTAAAALVAPSSSSSSTNKYNKRQHQIVTYRIDDDDDRVVRKEGTTTIIEEEEDNKAKTTTTSCQKQQRSSGMTLLIPDHHRSTSTVVTPSSSSVEGGWDLTTKSSPILPPWIPVYRSKTRQQQQQSNQNRKATTTTTNSDSTNGAKEEEQQQRQQDRQQDERDYKLTSAHAKYSIQLLQDALQTHIRHNSKPNNNRSSSSDNINNGFQHQDEQEQQQSFTERDADTVINSIFVASKNDVRLLLGAAEFLTLLLSVEEYHYAEDTNAVDNIVADAGGGSGGDGEEFFTVMTKDALIAAAFHYCDCVMAREAGVYDIVNGIMRNTVSIGNTPLLSVGREDDGDSDGYHDQPVVSFDVEDNSSMYGTMGKEEEEEAKEDIAESKMYMLKPADRDDARLTTDGGILVGEEDEIHVVDTNEVFEQDNTIIDHSSTNQRFEMKYIGSENDNNNDAGIDQFGKEAIQISQSASRIKRAEIMAKVISRKGSSHSLSSPWKKRQKNGDDSAASLRGLLLSMTDDWRGLAIRSTASLYRLRGILRHEYSSPDYFDLLDKSSSSSSGIGGGDNNSITSSIRQSHSDGSIEQHSGIVLAREALKIYAPLAQRLGMHRLKSELENVAFQVLYKRQYAVATALYAKNGAALQSVTSFLKKSVEEMLRNDEWLSGQLDRLTVTARVKQPYSLWRKLLKRRLKAMYSKDGILDASGAASSVVEELSIMQVSDAIALRVILRAKRVPSIEEHVDEDMSVFPMNAREEFLCYYVQNLLLKSWPAKDDRIKDYIKIPKPNGYQSLHYTARIFRYDQEWPFEIQIRSEMMHSRSENGVAAHWDYKIQGGSISEKDIDKLPLSTNTDSLMSLDESGIPSSFHPPLLTGTPEDVPEDNIPMGVSEDKNREVKKLSHASIVESYIDALTTARTSLLEEKVFIFYSPSSSALDGRVIGIPSGSTVADALVDVCNRSDFYKKDRLDDSGLVLLNGRESSMADNLSNGDVLTLPGLDSLNSS